MKEKTQQQYKKVRIRLTSNKDGYVASFKYKGEKYNVTSKIDTLCWCLAFDKIDELINKMGE